VTQFKRHPDCIHGRSPYGPGVVLLIKLQFQLPLGIVENARFLSTLVREWRNDHGVVSRCRQRTAQDANSLRLVTIIIRQHNVEWSSPVDEINARKTITSPRRGILASLLVSYMLTPSSTHQVM
jgi:hypothetical protein